MSKTIEIPDGDKTYTLEYTKDTVRTMERHGFNVDDVASKPMTTIPDLFAGAFLKHHPSVKRNKIDEIYDRLGGKRKLLNALVEMYNDTLETLMDGPDEGNEDWTPSWEIKD